MGVILDILLVILKVIGYTLLGILGLILLILILLLFVPIRYEGYVSYKDEFVLKGRISYLLRLVSARFSMENGKTDFSIRIGPYKPNGDSEKSKSWKKKKSKKKSKKGKKKKNTSADKVSEVAMLTEKAAEPDKKPTETVVEQEEIKEKPTETAVNPEEIKENPTEPAVKQEEINIKPVEEAENSKGIPDNSSEIPEVSAEADKKASDKKRKPKKKKSSLGDRLNSLKAKFNSIKEKFDRPKKEESKLSKIKRFLEDETNKKAIRTVYSSFKKLLKHILPQKIRGYVKFGTSDPGTTGKLLGVLGVFYAKYGRSLQIYPDFENQVIEAELRVKGRIRLFTLGVIGLKAYLNKDVKYLINQIKSFK